MRYIGIALGTSAAKLLLVASERGPGMGGAVLACGEYGTVALCMCRTPFTRTQPLREV